jgi:hypothetical protein
LLAEFRALVLSKMCRFFDDRKDLKLIVHESVPEVAAGRELVGWVRSDVFVDPRKALDELAALQAENSQLRRKQVELEKRLSSDDFSGYSFDELLEVLDNERLEVPPHLVGGKPMDVSLTEALLAVSDSLAVGIANSAPMSEQERFIFFHLAPKFAVYGLTERKQVNTHGIQRFQLSPQGARFLARLQPFHSQQKRRDSAQTASVLSDGAVKLNRRSTAKPPEIQSRKRSPRVRRKSR